jgi:hypothetical protein
LRAFEERESFAENAKHFIESHISHMTPSITGSALDTLRIGATLRSSARLDDVRMRTTP